MQQPLTPEFIRNKLATDDVWLEAAVKAIYRRQTSEEQQAGATLEHNGRGFNGVDARSGTYMANWLNQGKHLDGKWLVLARKIMPKYTAQLMQVATAKAQAIAARELQKA